MKERIVIEKELLEKIIKASPVQWFDNKEKTDKLILFGKEYKTEKVPETFEELKELCKDIKEVTITEEGHINVDLVYFTKDGEIYTYVEGVLTSSIFLPVSKGRTPQQMWQIVKSLILGEENER